MEHYELIVRIDERVNQLTSDVKEMKGDLLTLRTKTIAVSATIGVLVSLVISKFAEHLFK